MTDTANPGIWLRPERSRRGPPPEYSRAQIAGAAVVLADADGLPAVTMRSVSGAVGAGPASLYRYVATRGELLELMIDQVNGEFRYDALESGHWLTDLLNLAHQAKTIYLRHPWLLEALGAGTPLGPNAVSYLENALRVLRELDVSGQVKLEAIGMFSGVVRLLAGNEIDRQRAGQTQPEAQGSLADYLAHVVGAGQHPHLAAALTARPADSEPAEQEPLFDRVLVRIMTGLLQPPDPGQEIRASTKASGSKGARSSGPSPSPTSLTGTPSLR